MAWAWLLLVLGIVPIVSLIGLFIVILARAEQNRRSSRTPERTFGEFAFSEAEWEYVHKAEFVDDTRGRSILDRYSGIIAWLANSSAHGGKAVKFTDQFIYVFGDGKQKIFKVQDLNPGGTNVHLQGVRVLQLEPLKKLQVKVGISQRLQHERVDFDLEYLVPIPAAAYSHLTQIERKYDELIRRSDI